MSGLVDYAGLFPPAGLDMDSAVKNYHGHQADKESWMLGRFVCPAARLRELAEGLDKCLPDGFSRNGGWKLCVLVGSNQDPEAALAAIALQAAAIIEIEERFAGKVDVAAFESPIPVQAISDLDGFMARFSEAMVAGELTKRELYLELPDADRIAGDTAVLAAIARLRDRPGGRMGLVGAKFRCGGVTAGAFPTVARLAGVIDQSRQMGLALKFTAGLHHPVRYQSEDPPVLMHGFLNVFGAGLLAYGLDADPGVLENCLGETDPAAFTFTADGFRWRDFSVDTKAITRIRSKFLSGFGSCSFTEPRDDLQGLGLL